MFKATKNQRPKQRFAFNAYVSYLGKASKTWFVQLQTKKFQGFLWDKLLFFKTTSKSQHLFKTVRTIITNRRVEKLIYTKDNLLVTVGNDRTTPILINLCHLLVACTRFLSV